jgi:hypothetical protein
MKKCQQNHMDVDNGQGRFLQKNVMTTTVCENVTLVTEKDIKQSSTCINV